MNFKITKGVLLSSLLFTGAMSWNGYAVNYLSFKEGKVIQVTYSDIEQKINDIRDNIKIKHRKCHNLLKDVNPGLVKELEKEKAELDKIITDKALTVYASKTKNQENLLDKLALDPLNVIKEKNKDAASVLDSVKYIYSIKLIVLTIIKHEKHCELLENIKSMPDEMFSLPFKSDINAKKLLETVSRDNTFSGDLWEQMRNPTFETELFDNAIRDIIKEILESEADYIFNDRDENEKKKRSKEFEDLLNEKLKTLYNDLNKIIQYCLNS